MREVILEHDQPVMPEIEGLTIEQVGPPARSSQTSIINGRRSDRSVVTYNYRVTPLREGSFTIPPIQVSADGNVENGSSAFEMCEGEQGCDYGSVKNHEIREERFFIRELCPNHIDHAIMNASVRTTISVF